MATIDSLDQKISDFKENAESWMERVDKHFEKLNGQTAKNTDFRNKALGGFIVIGALGASSILGVVALWIKILIQ